MNSWYYSNILIYCNTLLAHCLQSTNIRVLITFKTTQENKNMKKEKKGKQVYI